MHTAAELASRLQAGIKALYIEDINLWNAVDLPFTREVSLHTAAISSIDSTLMIQKFQADAHQHLDIPCLAGNDFTVLDY